MYMWFGFNPAVNFCHFSTLLTLSVFAGATSTAPKFDLFCWFCHEAVHIRNFGVLKPIFIAFDHLFQQKVGGVFIRINK